MERRVSKRVFAIFAFLLFQMLIGLLTPVKTWDYQDGTPSDTNYERFGPRADKLLIKFYSSDSDEWSALARGEIDMTDWALTKLYYDLFTSNEINPYTGLPYNQTINLIPYGAEFGLSMLDVNNNNNQYLGNPQDPAYPNPLYPNPTSVKEMRQAIAHLVNRTHLIINIVGVFGVPIYTPVPPSMGVYTHPEIRPGGVLESLTYPYSRADAQAKLDSGGFPVGLDGWRYWDRNGNGIKEQNEDLDLRFFIRSDQGYLFDFGNYMANELEAVKVQVNRVYGTLNDARMYVMANGEFNLYTGTWSLGINPDHLNNWNWNSYWHIPGMPILLQVAEEFIEIPVKVNVLRGVTKTDEEIDEMIKEANKILEKAGTKLVFDKKKNINRNVSDEGNNDGKVTREERDKLRKKGVEELDNLFGKGKGIKITLVNDIIDGGACTTTGVSIHNPAIPNIFVKCTGTAKEKGRTIAHEFGHVFTLGSGHKIDGKTNADGNGHHPTDKDNLMWGTRPGGTNLTPDQKKEIQKNAKSRSGNGGTKKQSGNPGVVRLDTKHGSWTDDMGDAATPYIDLWIGSLFAEGPTANLDVTITVYGLNPTESNVRSRFQVLFNTDNNASTGSTFGSFIGIDKVLGITLNGTYPFASPSEFSAYLYHVASGINQTLAPGVVTRNEEFIDVVAPNIPLTYDHSDSISQSLDLNLLGSLADQIPTGIRATNLTTSEFDEANFTWIFRPSPAASVDMQPTTGIPGNPVSLSGTNFSPLSNVSIFIDENLILQTTTSSDGTFTANFIIPTVPAGNYFITAMDDNVLYDFSVLHVKGGFGPNYNGINNALFDTYKHGVLYADNAVDAQNNAWLAQVTFALEALSVPLWSYAGSKAMSRIYTGGNAWTPIGDGEDPYRGQYWDGTVNVVGYGLDSFWSFLNMHPRGFDRGTGNMTIRYGVKTDGLRSLNPIYSNTYSDFSLWDDKILDMIYERLLRPNPYNLGELIPWMAEHYEAGTYFHPVFGLSSKMRFTLRPDVTWSDGKPLTTADVYFTLVEVKNLLAAKGLPPPSWIKSVQDILDFKILDPYNFEVLLPVTSIWVPSWIVDIPILPKHIWKPIIVVGDPTTFAPDSNMVGAGPWRFVEYVEKSHILMVANRPGSTVKTNLSGSTPITSPNGYFRYQPLDVTVTGPNYSAKLPPGVLHNVDVSLHNLLATGNLVVDKYVYIDGGLMVGYPLTLELAPCTPHLETFTLNLTKGRHRIKVAVHISTPTWLASSWVNTTLIVWSTITEDITGSTFYDDVGWPSYPFKAQLPSPDIKVDGKDIAKAASAFGTWPGHPRWSPIADITGDYKDDGKDIAKIAKKFGWS